MIIGTGIDAVNIERTKRLDDAFIKRYYNTAEVQEYLNLKNDAAKAEFLASRFAVKEAYAKAYGTGFCKDVVPSEITTCHDNNGKPFIKLSGATEKSAKDAAIHLSITHENPLAIAMVILETN